MGAVFYGNWVHVYQCLQKESVSFVMENNKALSDFNAGAFCWITRDFECQTKFRCVSPKNSVDCQVVLNFRGVSLLGASAFGTTCV